MGNDPKIIYKCNVCGTEKLSHLFLNDVTPLQNNFMQTEIDALLLSKININLVWCNDCFHFSIIKEQKSLFDGGYNNEISGIGTDLNQLKAVCNLIRKKIVIRSSRIVEIGCGRGALLKLLSKSGFSNIQGYDPIVKNEYNKLVSSDYWSGEGDTTPDLLILRHTLEEIPDLEDFIGVIAKKRIKNLYIEITNISNLVINDDPFSIYPECENLFSITSLTRTMSKFGYFLTDVSTFFTGNWAGCWFRVSNDNCNSDDLIKSYKLNIRKLEKPVVLWGAGGRGSNILSFCKIDKNEIEFVVDVNKAKIGKYMPPNGQKVISPEELLFIKPKTVVVASGKFLKEIKAFLKKHVRVLTINQLR